jgi:hypothetical protein
MQQSIESEIYSLLHSSLIQTYHYIVSSENNVWISYGIEFNITLKIINHHSATPARTRKITVPRIPII